VTQSKNSSETYVALLRGINVGGIRIKIDALSKTFTDLGFRSVRTVLASGNVVFSTNPRAPSRLKRAIEAALEERFGYDAWIVLVTAAELAAIVNAFPFDEHAKDMQPYVLFASDAKPLAELAKLGPTLDGEVERIQKGAGALYWQVERGKTLKSTFGKATSAARYKSTTTTRNMRTLRKVLAATE
jgi:uncharacterized protein (DUF1697 family)